MRKLLKKILPESIYGAMRKTINEINDVYEKKTKYGLIAVDVTSNCNLRCSFCYNDYSEIKGNTLMTENNFEKALRLLPLVYSNYFFMSCQFEPFLHPAFILFLEKIPPQYRKKVFFTTSLTTSISDEDFQRLSRLNLSHINISLDSLNPIVYEKIRKGAKFDRFKNNLERIVKAFSRSNYAPPIRYITVVLKENYNEISSLIETCHNSFLSSGNEIRFVYQAAHLSLEWKKKNLVSNQEWIELKENCAKSPFNTVVLTPPSVYFPDDNQPYSRTPENSGDFKNDAKMHEAPFGILINSKGIVSLFGKREIQFDLNKIDNPYIFFEKKRGFLRKKYKTSVKK